MLEFKKAKRSMARVKIAIGGVSGSGKTMSSLLLAFGLEKAEHKDWSDEECWSHICIVDTENRSASLYVGSEVNGTRIGEYNAIDIDPPFNPKKYVEAINLAEKNDQHVIIIDSMSHAWSAAGGALDHQNDLVAKGVNSYAAWQPVKKDIRAMMDAILQSPAHIIASFRAKQEYSQEKDERGKTVIRKLGMGFVFQDGMEYEFTSLFYLDENHNANATKDRTGMFASDEFFVINEKTGEKFYNWLSTSSHEVQKPQEPLPFTMDELDSLIKATFTREDKAEESKAKAEVFDRIKSICGVQNYHNVKDNSLLIAVWNEFKKEIK